MALDGVTLSGNFSGLGAGAIGNFGTAILNNLTVEGNETEGSGAGIYNGFRMTLMNSTIEGNFNGYGTGIFNEAMATLTASNTTVSGNRLGAIYNRGAATLSNLTITSNAVERVGAIYNDVGTLGASLIMVNTILGDNAGGDCGGPTPVVSGGHNLSSDGTCPLVGPGDMTNTDPLLGPLADNGGPTQTHALLTDSPAIDAGDNASCPTTDQRGVDRPLDGNADGTAICDIGAYEAPSAPARTPSPAPPSPTPASTEAPAAAPSAGLPSSPITALPVSLPRTGGRAGANSPAPTGALTAAVGVIALASAAWALRSRSPPGR